MFNVVSCKKNTKIIDIEISGWTNMHSMLMSSLDLDYNLYIGEKIDPEYNGPHPNFKINIEDFLEFVDTII